MWVLGPQVGGLGPTKATEPPEVTMAYFPNVVKYERNEMVAETLNYWRFLPSALEFILIRKSKHGDGSCAAKQMS